MVLGKLDGILDILCTLLFNYDLEVWKVQAPRSGTSSLNSNTRRKVLKLNAKRVE